MKDRLLRLSTAVAVVIGTTALLVPPAAAAARPDLKVTSLSKPPANLRRGRTFNVTDVTKNVGKATAKASTTRYYLSRDNKRGGLADIRLAKVRKVKILGRGRAHRGTVRGVVVPKSIAASSYFLLACADDLKRVRESNERNNCRASTTKMKVSAGPPTPAITDTEPTSPSNTDDTPLVKGTAETGATVRIYEETCTGLLVATGSAADFGSTGLQITNPVASDGSAVNYVAIATDNVGNVSACSAMEPYEFDTDLPGDVTFDTRPAAISSQNPVQWIWTGELGSSYECSLVKGSTPVDAASCNGGTYNSPDLATMPEWGDGTYTFSVTQTDDAGNVALAPTTDEFILDLTPPGDATVLTEPTTPSNDPTPTWTFDGTLASDAHYECQLRRNGVVIQAFSACGDPDPTKTYDLSNATTYPDGTYVFEVRQTDEAGNSSTPDVSNGFVLDRIALAPTFEQEPADPSNYATPTWEFSGEAGATFECTLRDGTDAVIGGPADCTTGTTYTFDLSDDVTHPDGNYSLSVTQVDAASNPSSAATSTFELDRQAPDAPTVDSSPDDPSNDVTPTWTFSSLELGPVTFQCELKRGLTTVASGACDGGAFTPGVALVDQGIYTLEVRQTDGAANQSAAASSSFTLDTDPPGAPTFSAIPDDPSNDTTPTWSWTGEAGATYECTLSKDTVEVETVPCDSATYTASDLISSGDISLDVVQTDEAGNPSLTATDSFELDTDPPGAPTGLNVSPASPANNNSPTVSGSAEAASTVRVFTDDTCATGSPAWSGIATGGSFSIPVSVGDNTTTSFWARTRDAAGNSSPCSATSTSAYLEDSAAPTGPTGLNVTPVGPANNNNPTVAGSAEAASVVKLYSNSTCSTGNVAWTATATAGSFSIPVTVVDNSLTTFYATATDAAGNTSPCSTSTVSYREDSAAPAPPTLNSTSPASPGTDAQPEVIGSAEGGSVVRLYTRSDCIGTGAASGGAATFSSPGLTVNVPPNSAETFYGTATDQAGNVSGCSATGRLYENLLPEVEPNDTPLQGNAVPDLDSDGQADSPTTWTGSLVALDVDYYRFTVPDGTNFSAQTFDRSSGSSCGIQTELTLYDTDGTTVRASDLTGGMNSCSLIDGTASPPTPGASNLPAGEYYLSVETPGLSANYRVVIDLDLGDLVELEPGNDALATATGTVRRDRLIRGTTDGDANKADYFKLDLPSASIVRFESFGPTVGECPSGLQTRLDWTDGVLPGYVDNESAGVQACGALVVYVPAGVSHLRLTPGSTAADSPYTIEVDIQSDAMTESEPNDSRATANSVVADSNTYLKGSIATSDSDWYRFTIPSGTSVRIEVIEAGIPPQVGGASEPCSTGSPPPMAPRLQLTDSDGLELAADSTDGRGACSLIDGTSTTPRDDWPGRGTLTEYWLKVDSPSADPDSGVFDYRVAITVR